MLCPGVTCRPHHRILHLWGTRGCDTQPARPQPTQEEDDSPSLHKSEIINIIKLIMAPKRLNSGKNKESSKSASVSEAQPCTNGFTGITPDVFMGGDSTSNNLPPLPPFSPPLLCYPSSAFTYGRQSLENKEIFSLRPNRKQGFHLSNGSFA
ncbi:hypothetical protein E2C01_032727 [Portunus trituberculatus]|uniref:Uncharacterized protein n=1 Tax=Portunus trituberculatus TaxID=210409 RepID=A0A5B7F1R6_PORTR|nr:hypothetical protein [Portunus trituberculatus]